MARQRVSKAQVTLYEQDRDRVKLDLERLANGYLSGNLSLSGFKEEMQDRLKQYYIRVALIAKGAHPFTRKDREDLQKFLGLIYGFLDGFVEDLGNYKVLATDQGVISRATSYGVGWGVFSRFSLPGPIADMLPSLPGISCLGDGDCGCILEWEVVDDAVYIYWIVNPFKQHCPVCADNGIEWGPYEILLEELDIEEWDEEDFWEDDFSF